MTKNRSRLALAALGASALVLVAGASLGAQTAPRTLPANPQQQTQAPAPDQGQGRPEGRRGNRIDRRLDFLHYELRITPAQQHLWDNFAEAVRGDAQQIRDRLGAPGQGRQADNGPGRNGPRDNGQRGERRGPPSVVDRLERRQQALANQTAQLDHLLTTLRPLYAALDAGQKRTADRLMFEEGNRFGRGPGRFAMNGRFNRPSDRDYR